MDSTTLTAEEKKQLVLVFSNMRNNLEGYMKDRDFKMSNAQIFTFLMYAPVCLAVASDRQVDESEIRLLDNISKDIDVTTAVNLDLMEIIAIAPEPSDIMLNEEFNMRVDAELLFLSRNIDKYEKPIIESVKSMLKLDKNPESETSLNATFSKWFEFVIEQNASKNKEEELEKVKGYKQKIGIK